MRVAVVGSGLSGLVAAHELARSGGVHVTLYEKDDHIGGTKTIAVDGGSGCVTVNLDLMVFNRVTSPNLMEWFERIGVDIKTSDMSFSASMRLNKGKGFEWGSQNGISSVLAQKSNLISPRFWLVVHEIFKFKNHALKYLEDHGRNPNRNETLGQFIQPHRYSQLFQDAYLIPMCACIWSCPSQGIFGFPARFVLSFFHDNHLLELFSHLQWLTIKGGSESYVNKVKEELGSMGCQIKTGCELSSVSRFNGGYRILEIDGSEEMYDRIIFCVHAPNALKLLGTEATHDELRVLGAFQYIFSDVYFHCDESFMPHNSSAWSARNFLGTTGSGVCVTYWLNILQNIESTGPFLVTLNPPRVPNHVLLKWHTSHPIPSLAASKATLELNDIQGKRGIWFCIPYQGYANHEDSVKAGKAIASGLIGRQCDLLVNPKPMIPSWIEAGARFLVERNLDRYITIGNFSMLEEGGTTLSFGKACEKCQLKSVILVHNPQFYWKIAIEGDLGFEYSYINGYISFVDKKEGLLNIIQIIFANRGERKRLSSNASNKSRYIRKGWWTPLLGINGVALAKYVLREALRKNTVSKARKNISEHYDLSNDFFALFLYPTMSYSCGIFKAKVVSGHHVLEFGCGWGTFAIQLVKKTGCKYTGITLSEEQLKYAKRMVKESGLECIAITEELYDKLRTRPEFTKEYIFPGGCLPCLARLASAMSNASRLCIQHVENIGDHYYPTLIRWRDKFVDNREKASALGFDEKFIRTWDYFLNYSAAMFKSRIAINYQIVFARPGNAKLPSYVTIS